MENGSNRVSGSWRFRIEYSPLSRAAREEFREREEVLSVLAQGLECRERVGPQARDLLSRAINAVNLWKCQLARRGVLGDGFPELRLRLGDIEEIIDGLKHESDQVAPAVAERERARSRSGANGPDPARTPDERTSLVAMNLAQAILGRLVRRKPAKRVEHLSRDHRGCGVRHLVRDSPGLGRCGTGRMQSERQKGVAGEDRHRVAESDMGGGLSPPQSVVVEGWEVVVDETEGVHHLDRTRRLEGRKWIPAHGLAAPKSEEGTEPLPASEQRVGNRFREILGIACLGNEPREPLLNRRHERRREDLRLLRECCAHRAKCSPIADDRITMIASMSALYSNLELFMERGGPVMWPLLALSILSVTLTVERAWFWHRMSARGTRVRLRALVNALRMNDAETVVLLAKEDDGPYAAVAADLACDGPSDAIAIAAVERQRPRLERFLNVQSTIVTAAPMLGILGTVSGIIRSFELLGGKDTLSDPRLVSAGIAEALVATASGLVVALVSLFPYMYFRGHSDKAIGIMEGLIASAKLGVEKQGGDPNSSLRSTSADTPMTII